MTDRISEYLNRVPGAYQADDGRRYWTREQVLEAVKECGTPPPQSQMVVADIPLLADLQRHVDEVGHTETGQNIAAAIEVIGTLVSKIADWQKLGAQAESQLEESGKLMEQSEAEIWALREKIDRLSAPADQTVATKSESTVDQTAGSKPIALISEGALRHLLQDTGGTFRISAPKWPTKTETVPLYLAPPPATDQMTASTSDHYASLKALTDQMAGNPKAWLWEHPDHQAKVYFWRLSEGHIRDGWTERPLFEGAPPATDRKNAE